MNYMTFVGMLKREGVSDHGVIQDLWTSTPNKGNLSEGQAREGARRVADAMHPRPKTGIAVPNGRGWTDSSNIKR